MDPSQLPLFEDVDVIQVGARNMQNFNLLKILGAQPKPVMIKRGMSSTYEEWLMSAEYVMASGNKQVILCERGIRTFETYTRNTLDLSAVPALRHLTHLPVIVDPSHATGKSALVTPLALGAVATGCDGLLIEVHNDPAHALSDGPQSLNPEAFDALGRKLIALRAFLKDGEAD
jgi:3-deoxy-7-phosphoheptulonate synthase